MYQVLLERSAEKDLKRLPPKVQPRAISILRSLASQPRTPDIALEATIGANR